MKLARISQRILSSIPMIAVMVLVVFVFLRFLPGDPVSIMMGNSGTVSQAQINEMRAELGLNQPLYMQVGTFIKHLFEGNLGQSIVFHQPVVSLLKATFPATIELALAALVFALVVGLPMGVLAALKRNSFIDRMTMTVSFLGISMPSFWLGLITIILFAVNVHAFPTSGRIGDGVHLHVITGFYLLDSVLTGNWAAFKDVLWHLVLPGIAMGAELMAIVARVTRSSMIDILGREYVVYSEAKGIRYWQTILKHAFPNAMIPTVTVVGLQIGVLLGGNMIVETVFGWPGLGRLVVQSIFARDYPVIQGAVLLYAVTFVVANLLVDIVYTLINPKLEV